MSLSNEQWEFLQDLSSLILFAQRKGIKLTGGELMRPKLMQEHYFKTGKSKTLNSYHLKKLAIDLNIFIGGKLTYEKSDTKILGNYWESLNPKNRWGGNFKSLKDTNHFERKV